MTDFSFAIDFVLKNEGGFNDSPNDTGGATNFGISLRFLRSLTVEKLRKYGIFHAPEILGVSDIQALTQDQAVKIYHDEFWTLIDFTLINSQRIANYLFDMTVMHGLNQAIKILQRATWAVYLNPFLPDDGFYGEKTLAEVNQTNVNLLCIALSAERAGFVRLLAAINPKDRENLHGWLNRCYRI
jgi:lysozyme family protein